MNMGRSGVAVTIGVLLTVLCVPAALAVRPASQSPAVLVPPAPSEVDVAYLGGDGGEAVTPIAVTATGNGVGAQLSSWGVESGAAPVHLHDSAVHVDGSQIQLHALVEDPSSTVPHMLLAASIDAGEFVLTTWHVGADGAFSALDLAAFDPDPTGGLGLEVKRFALANRGQSASGGTDVSSFQLFTSMAIGHTSSAASDSLWARSFSVDATSGEITELFGGSEVRDTHEATSLDVAYQPGREEFVVAFRDLNGILAHDYWSMSETGELTSEGLSSSGYTIDGRADPDTNSAVVVEPTEDLAMAAMGNLGLVSALRPDLDTQPELVTWESHHFCDGTGCKSAPYRIARNEEDTHPGPGVTLPDVPDLTDSGAPVFHPILGGGAEWGVTRSVSAVASGDVDGDGDEEIAIGRDAGDGMRYQVLGVDAGEWVTLDKGGSNWGVTRRVSALAMGDVDGDDNDELVIARNAGGGMRYQISDYVDGEFVGILKGGGDGWNATRGITALAMGDVDADDDEELAMGRNEGGGMRYQVIDYEGGEWAPVLKNGGEGWPSTRQVTALAIGDFNQDGHDDLALGRDADTDWRYAVRRSHFGKWPTVLKAGEGWGSTRYVTALAAADFDVNGDVDLAIGRDAGDGMRYQILGYAGGWTPLLEEGGVGWGVTRGVTALTTGDADGSGGSDLAIARNDGVYMRFEVLKFDLAAEEWDHTHPEGGWNWGVTRHPTALAFADVDGEGTDEFLLGLDDGSGPRYRLLDQPTTRRVRGSVSDTLIEANSGEGAGRLYREIPAGESPIAQNASIGKFLTLLLAVEAVTASPDPPNLSDEVKISKNAAEVVGSHVGPANCEPAEKCLQEGDKWRLEDLLTAMMLESDNRAAVAIAEHLAGSQKAFVVKVAQRANAIRAELGLAARFDEDCVSGGDYDPAGGMACFTHPAGSSLTTDQDLVTLWRYAKQYPLFQTFVTRVADLEVCGTDSQGNPKCLDPIFKFLTNQYLWLDGWKSGNGGHSPGFGVPRCTTCLTAATTRLDRTLIVTLHQTGAWWDDHDRMANWGYRRLFAPDERATNDAGQFIDFGLDAASSELALTATLDATRQLSVCAWTVQVDAGAIGNGSCSAEEVQGLPDGTPGDFAPTMVDIAQLPTGLADGDFVTGEVVVGVGGPSLTLRAWRVGPRFEK